MEEVLEERHPGVFRVILIALTVIHSRKSGAQDVDVKFSSVKGFYSDIHWCRAVFLVEVVSYTLVPRHYLVTLIVSFWLFLISKRVFQFFFAEALNVL